MASRRSSASSSSQHSRPSSHHGDLEESHEVPVEALVQHLLDAKKSLSSMAQVLRANEIVTAARQAHEESVILGAQAQFLRRGINDQIRLLFRARRSMNKTYDSGKREFKQVIRSLDAANEQLETTMNVLRERTVESAFRPKGEERRNLLDFVDVVQVDTMHNSLKDNIGALQSTQTSFDGDLLRFETDLRALTNTISAAHLPSPSASNSYQPVPHLLASLMEGSHDMAELLASLTKHFDLCVTAVRTTEGGAALARRKAAEASQSQVDGNNVSISGVIAEQESHMAELDPISAEERAEMLQVVAQDASEVADVVQEINERLHNMEDEYYHLVEQTNQVKATYTTTLNAFQVLEDISTRFRSYIAAETEFRDRWIAEHETISAKMDEMEQLRLFYENYAGSYDSLLLEVERRRAQEERVLNIWRKAKESVDRIIDADEKQRENFRHEIAEYIPTDLWPGMDDPIRRWDVMPVGPGEDESGDTPTLDKSVVQAAASRLGRD
ncbi:kinase activator [Pestalotiopsis sp. NC0098]|nr:kinase activator [Pestalotiopsis sp. NC0098]